MVLFKESGLGAAALTVCPISAGPAALDYSVGSMSCRVTRIKEVRQLRRHLSDQLRARQASLVALGPGKREFSRT